MIIASCPVRISLGSADHSPFAERYGGVALNFCIQEYVYTIVRKRTDLESSKYRVSYSRNEFCNSLNDIKHPLVREAIRKVGISDPLEIIHSSSIPSQLGLATSSSMAIALLKALFFYRNITGLLPIPSRVINGS
jgi:D-glycero-alpha-D-manno-heptose-7-phosphate kinase